MSKTAIVILAAGNSPRLGIPKQVLPFGNRTLVEHVVNEAVKAGLPTVVITGSNVSEVAQALGQQNVMMAYNQHWEEGMGSSIRLGVASLLFKQRDLKNIITAVCDQPFVSAELFQMLMQKKSESGKGIVACAYAGTVGTPVLFDKKYFSALQQLEGKDGAKGLLKRYADDVETVLFEQGSIDIDTEDDYQNLQTMQRHN